MKRKNNFYLLLSALLCGCNSINSSTINETTISSSSLENSSITNIISSSLETKITIKSLIEDFKNGLKLEVIGTEKYNDTTNNLYLQTTSKEKEFSFIQYKDKEHKEKRLHEYYTSLAKDEQVYATRLDVSNKYNYYPVYNVATYEYFTWNDGYNNPFLTLTEEDFIEDGNSFNLKTESLSKSNAVTNLFYGNPGLSLDSLEISYDASGIISFYCDAYFDGKTTYEYSFEAKVLSKGISTEMDYRVIPYEKVTDNLFSSMLTQLKKNNYTATVYNFYNDVIENVSYLYSNNDKLYYETGEYKTGFYLLDDKTVQEITKSGSTFVKVGEPMKGSLDEVRPLFKINRACFDLNAGVYKLKDNVEGSISVITLFEANAEELDNFTITKTDNGYTFTNISGKNKTVVIFTNIGNTDVGFTKDTVR